MGKKRTRRMAALLLALLLALPAPSALAAESALESASSASSQAPEGESSGEESAAQPAEESSAPESSQPAGEESQPGEGESSQEEPSSQEPSSSQEESSSQVPEDESTGEESGISMEDSQQETFASYPLLVVGGHESYMSGEAGARFYPDRAMTRAEMAQVLYNLLASYPPVTGGSFSDVSDSAWYATAVNTLVELDVLSGYEDGTFRPNNAVTRAEFVTAVCKCFDNLSTGSAGFSDVSGHWAEGFVNQAVAEDWISGFPDGTFRPDESIQRCQVTAILNKALERTGSGFAADAGTQEFVDVPSSHWAYEHIAEAADPVGSAIETGCTVRVTATNGLNLRSSASTSSSVVTVLSTGALLTVTSVESNGWLGVRTGSGRTGYVSGEFVEYVSGPTDTPDPEPEPEPDPDPDGFEVGQTVRVTAEPSLRLRSGPGTNYEAITSLATGVRLTITSIESNGWLGVETASGVAGYVHPDYVEVYTGGGGGGYNPPVTYYTLRFETGGGSDIPSVQGTYNTYIDLTKYVPAWRGHAFIGWYSERSLTNKVSGVYLTKDMTVYAGWRVDENPGTGVNPFTDISEKDWFYGDVMFVYENGLMLGTSKTLFSPHGTAMRGMMATILWRMEGSPVPKGKNSFTDVEAGKWYADAITWTAENGIFAGYGKDKFGPDDPITREQLAAIFYRYADYKGYDLTVKGDLDKFKDADKITDYAKTAMQWAVGSGLVKGKSGNLLDPQGTATRAEIAAMLHRFIEKYELVQGKAPGGLMGWIDPKRLQIPKTGDSSVLGLWGISLCTSLAGCLALTTWQIRRRREEEALQIIEK